MSQHDQPAGRPEGAAAQAGSRSSAIRKTYWRRQLRRTTILLSIWAIVGFGLSILFVEELNHIKLGEMPLGFWMAQQGSIYVFILLVLAYALLMERADRQAGLDETREGRIGIGRSVEGQ